MAMKQCSRCGSGATDTATECAVCGNVFEGAAAPAAPAAPPASPPAAPPSYLQSASTAAPAASPLAAPAPPPGAPSPLTAPPPAPVAAAKVEQVPGIPGLQHQPQGLGGGSGEVRLSLTGEVMEVPAPTQRGAGPGGYGPPAGARPGGGGRPSGPPPSARGAARPGPMREEVETKGGAAGIVFLVLLIAALGSVGGWYWYNNRTNPKDQALAAYKALLKDQDWKTSYGLVAFSNAEKTKYPTADAWAKHQEELMNSMPGAKAALEQLKAGVSEMTVGEPVMTEKGADVPTSAKLSIMGQSLTFKGTAHMIKEGGIWKLDGTGAEGNGAKVGQDLLGKPDLPAGMGGGMGMPGMGGGMAR